MRQGHVDPKYRALDEAKSRLVRALDTDVQRGPLLNTKHLADAIEELIDAKIAAALDRRY